MRHTVRAVAMVLFLVSARQSESALIQWTDWTASNLLSASGTAGSLGVSFSGQLQFAQLGFNNMVGGGASSTTDYWIENSPPPYTGNALVDNRPPGFELLAFNGASTNSLTFSAPVLNPLMAIVSMGQSGLAVTYDFDTPFTVLSEGRGFWGDGTFSVGAGDVLVGNELHAVIQFHGPVSQINWRSSAEN